jgi:hypothetical protein
VDDIEPPAVLSKKYVFMEVFKNFVKRFLCFLYVSQFLSVFCLRNLLWYIFFYPKEVTEIFNNFFVNVAKDIGDKNIKIDKTHPSINKIETNRTNKDKLFFKPINEDFVTKQINKLNIKKATGYDGIYKI